MMCDGTRIVDPFAPLDADGFVHEEKVETKVQYEDEIDEAIDEEEEIEISGRRC